MSWHEPIPLSNTFWLKCVTIEEAQPSQWDNWQHNGFETHWTVADHWGMGWRGWHWQWQSVWHQAITLTPIPSNHQTPSLSSLFTLKLKPLPSSHSSTLLTSPFCTLHAFHTAIIKHHHNHTYLFVIWSVPSSMWKCCKSLSQVFCHCLRWHWASSCPELFINPISPPCCVFYVTKTTLTSGQGPCFFLEQKQWWSPFSHDWLQVVFFLVSIISSTSIIEEWIVTHSCFKSGHVKKVWVSFIVLALSVHPYNPPWGHLGTLLSLAHWLWFERNTCISLFCIWFVFQFSIWGLFFVLNELSTNLLQLFIMTWVLHLSSL